MKFLLKRVNIDVTIRPSYRQKQDAIISNWKIGEKVIFK